MRNSAAAVELPRDGVQPSTAKRIDRSRIIQYALAILATLLVLCPIVPILYQSFIDRPLYEEGQAFTLANYATLLTDPAFLHTATNTLIFSVSASIFGTALGLIAAILIGRTDMPGRRLIGTFMVWPIFVSHLVLAFGWLIAYGPAGYLTMLIQSLIGVEPWNLYSMSGMALVAGVTTAPLTFLYCLASGSLAQASLEDAARTCGAGPIRTLWSVTLPLLLPAIAYSFLLFTGALEMLAVPLVLGEPARIQLFTTLLYDRGFASPHPDYGIVSTAGLLLIAVIVLMLMVQARLFANGQRFVTVGGKAGRPRTMPLGPMRWFACIALAAYIFLFILVPICALFLRASVSILSPLVPFWEYFSWTNIEQFLLPEKIRSLVNTILVSGIGAGIGTLFVALLAVVVHRSELRFRGALEYVALFPRAIPGLVAGMGIFYAMAVTPGFGLLRDTIWILIIAFIIRFIPLAFGTLSASLMQIGRELDNSARVVGADWWTTTYRIVLPLMKPAMLSSYTLLFVYFLKEYSSVIFLYTPGNEVLGASMVVAWENGNTGLVAVFSSVQILIAVVAIYAARFLLGVKIYEQPNSR